MPIEINTTLTITEVRLLRYALSVVKNRADQQITQGTTPSDRYHAKQASDTYLALADKLARAEKAALRERGVAV